MITAGLVHALSIWGTFAGKTRLFGRHNFLASSFGDSIPQRTLIAWIFHAPWHRYFTFFLSFLFKIEFPRGFLGTKQQGHHSKSQGKSKDFSAVCKEVTSRLGINLVHTQPRPLATLLYIFLKFSFSKSSCLEGFLGTKQQGHHSKSQGKSKDFSAVCKEVTSDSG